MPENYSPDAVEPSLSFAAAVLMLLGFGVGALMAVLAVPFLAPVVSQSLLGPEPKAYWDLARASGIVAYVLIWLSVVLGMTVSNKMARVFPGGPTAVELHQFTSLLGIGLALFHVVILLGDRYIGYSVVQVLVPFASVHYRPVWVGMGQIAFYAIIPVAFSFYIRKHIGFRLWRALHYASFVVYAWITLHGMLAGSDTTAPFMLSLYGVTGAAVYFLTIYRILTMARAHA